jgi:site-specific DNA recombinase
MVGAVVHTRSQAARTALIKTRSAQRIMYNSADSIRWLDELSASPNLNIESLAAREGKTERWIRRTISLAFLCPALVKAAIDGRLPRGFGVKRLMDLPMAWPDQWSALGLRAPAER